MKKIVFIIDNFITAGAQVHLARLANGLSKTSFKVKVISLGKTDAMIQRILPSQFIVEVDMSSIRNIHFWPNFWQLIRTLKEEKPQIVHTYLNTANVFGVLAARLARVPFILSSRRDMGHFRTSRIGWLEAFLNRLVIKIVCVSDAVRAITIEREGVQQGKTVVLYSGVDPLHFCPMAERKSASVNIGMVATMNRELKGHKYFLDVALRILAKQQNVKFVLIGDGKIRPSLEEFVKSHNVAQCIEFKGATSETKKELAELDIFVMPSKSEGFSNAILEAMAMELPVVANAVEGNLEIIEEGKTGFLTKPDNPDDMGEKILTLIHDPELRRSLGRAGRQRILSNFTIDHMVDRYRNFYERLMNK